MKSEPSRRERCRGHHCAVVHCTGFKYAGSPWRMGTGAGISSPRAAGMRAARPDPAEETTQRGIPRSSVPDSRGAHYYLFMRFDERTIGTIYRAFSRSTSGKLSPGPPLGPSRGGIAPTCARSVLSLRFSARSTSAHLELVRTPSSGVHGSRELTPTTAFVQRGSHYSLFARLPREREIKKTANVPANERDAARCGFLFIFTLHGAFHRKIHSSERTSPDIWTDLLPCPRAALALSARRYATVEAFYFTWLFSFFLSFFCFFTFRPVLPLLSPPLSPIVLQLMPGSSLTRPGKTFFGDLSACRKLISRIVLAIGPVWITLSAHCGADEEHICSFDRGDSRSRWDSYRLGPVPRSSDRRPSSASNAI